MQAETAARLDHIEAQLSYLAPGTDNPFVYAYQPPPGMPARNGASEARRVAIADGRPFSDSFSLDTEGFALRRHASAVADFYDDAEVRRVYYPEVEKLVGEATGAAKIVIFDHTLRNSARGAAGTKLREAAASVHNDYTDRSAPQRVRDLLSPDEAEARLKKRFIEINVWRPIAGPVESWPLAVCDAGSVDRRDLVVSERRYPDRVGETYAVRYNSRHRWFYFSRMRRDEALLIKCFDSEQDGRARLAVHTAFDDPTSPEGARPRESIEVRMFAFF
jgi:hypothetical protein